MCPAFSVTRSAPRSIESLRTVVWTWLAAAPGGVLKTSFECQEPVQSDRTCLFVHQGTNTAQSHPSQPKSAWVGADLERAGSSRLHQEQLWASSEATASVVGECILRQSPSHAYLTCFHHPRVYSYPTLHILTLMAPTSFSVPHKTHETRLAPSTLPTNGLLHRKLVGEPRTRHL